MSTTSTLRDAYMKHFSDADFRTSGLTRRKPCSGQGFFPVCSGRWSTPKTPPRWLVLGQDFGSDKGLSSSGESASNPTWKGLLDLLGRSNIPPGDCFFSNTIMGARPDGKNLGRSPGFKDRKFVNKCASFLREQVRIVQPRGIIVMGLHALDVIALAEPNLPSGHQFKVWDQQTNRVPIDCRIGRWRGPLVLIVHPCYRRLNVWRRSASAKVFSDRSQEGEAVEESLLRSLAKFAT